MRFFIDLVFCCFYAGTQAMTPILEANNVMPIACSGNRHYRHTKLVDKKSVVAERWRPSLCTISEDGVVKSGKAVGATRPGNTQMGNFKPRSNSQGCAYRSEIRAGDSFQKSIPTFSPAAFLF
ncbi:unnamed protein product [Ilex paraguariensis]|uniref:Secreted protein n=1 Tax=Ilex paraguariensis TaxID=185542 RepID=A0ABC8T286_9AQUA